LPAWVRDSEDPLPKDALTDPVARLAVLADLAKLRAAELREMPAVAGKPPRRSDMVLARRLWGLWHHLGGSLPANNRAFDNFGRKWPFLEFAEAVGETVVKGFRAEGAARRLLKAWTEARREVGEIP
jgi:hypothetical protein